jgi:hypothetical protein
MTYGWPIKIFLPVMYLIIFLIGLIGGFTLGYYIYYNLYYILGNASILLLIATRKKMHTVTNIFIGLLATGDLLIVLFCMPFTVPTLYIYEV